MSSAITLVGQTRINQLRGAEQPLIIDRMVLALIPGLDPTLAVDRAQQMPAPGDIVHTATIESNHKGYVDPDQVVYSIVLGSDVGNFLFNWIGLVEETTDIVIAITTTPETPKRKTNLANNTTGNNITRNFMIQFLDAQNLTGVTVAAETWQFDYQADFAAHREMLVDPTQEGSERKHVTDSQAKLWQDHASSPHDYAPYNGNETQIFKAAPGIEGNDVVVKSQVASEESIGLIELASPQEVFDRIDKFRAITPFTLASLPNSPSINGYRVLTDGYIEQWGEYIYYDSGLIQITFPVAFPHACLSVMMSEANRLAIAENTTVQVMTQTYFLAYKGEGIYCHWRALGY